MAYNVGLEVGLQNSISVLCEICPAKVNEQAKDIKWASVRVPGRDDGSILRRHLQRLYK